MCRRTGATSLGTAMSMNRDVSSGAVARRRSGREVGAAQPLSHVSALKAREPIRAARQAAIPGRILLRAGFGEAHPWIGAQARDR